MALVTISNTQGRVPVTIFHVQDRINLGNYKELEQAARQAYDGGMRNLVIDLTKSESLTSIGIRSIVAVYKMLAQGDEKHLKLVGVISSVRDMLEIAGITRHIEIYESLDDAVASF